MKKLCIANEFFHRKLEECTGFFSEGGLNLTSGIDLAKLREKMLIDSPSLINWCVKKVLI